MQAPSQCWSRHGGSRAPFLAAIADIVIWVVTGGYSWSPTYAGREAVLNDLQGHFRSRSRGAAAGGAEVRDLAAALQGAGVALGRSLPAPETWDMLSVKAHFVRGPGALSGDERVQRLVTWLAEEAAATGT